MFDIDVVPIGNPYGYNHDQRTNADGIDINRLNTSSGTVEAQALMGVIDEKVRDIFIDFHNCETDKSASQYKGVTGAFSLANDMPFTEQVKMWSIYLSTGASVARLLRKYWDMPDDNNTENFLPWSGTTNQTFRQYGYTHTKNGVTVGSPISACNELSRNSYTYSNSTTEFNQKSLITGNTMCDYIIRAILDKLYNIYLGG